MNVAFYLIANTLMIYSFYLLIGTFIDKKDISNWCFFAAYAAYYIVNSLGYLLFSFYLINISTNLISIFLITFMYQAKIGKRVFVTVLVYVIGMFIDGVWTCIVKFFNTDESFIFNVFISNITLFFAAVLIKSIVKDKFKTSLAINAIYYFAIIFIPLASIVVGALTLPPYNIKSLVIGSVLLLINFLVFYFFDQIVKSYYIQQEAKNIELNNLHVVHELEIAEQTRNYYMNQCELMRESTEQMRSFRHDMKNQLYCLKQLNDKGRKNEVSAQLEKFLDGIDSDKQYSSSGNMIVDSLVNYKLRNAKMLGVKVETEISISDKLDIEINDLITVLGNLLDNAVTALSDEKVIDKWLFLKIVYDRGRVIINIQNSYAAPVEYVNGEIVTTKEDAENHGIGLKNIKAAVEKYNGYVEINHQNNIFSVDILMFV